MAKTGYSKSGKSLKALRRYYAIKNAAKRAGSPESPPVRKSKSVDELSKRIAAELQDQKEANIRRGQLDMPTERSALPDIDIIKEPTFSLKTNMSMDPNQAGTSPPLWIVWLVGIFLTVAMVFMLIHLTKISRQNPPARQ